MYQQEQLLNLLKENAKRAYFVIGVTLISLAIGIILFPKVLAYSLAFVLFTGGFFLIIQGFKIKTNKKHTSKNESYYSHYEIYNN